MLFEKGSGGPGVHFCRTPPKLRTKPTRSQKAAYRHEFWLKLVEGRYPCTITGRPHQFSTQEIADLFDVTISAVRVGIKDARKTRLKIQELLAEGERDA
jgi:hypothetical protein